MSDTNWSLFGFEIKRKRQEADNAPASFTPPTDDTGGQVVASGGFTSSYVNLEGGSRNEAELVTKYRKLSLQPEVEAAVDEIVNESISYSPEGRIVDIVLDDVLISDDIKQTIRDEFDNILDLLDFQHKAYEIFRQWYVDGRIFYHAIVDNQDLSKGLTEIRFIDPRNLRKIKQIAPARKDADGNVRQQILDYFIFSPRGFDAARGGGSYTTNRNDIKISRDSIIYATSGLLDESGQFVLSYLHKALKPANQLRTLEDALVIYRLARAPERRIWYLDTGTLPKAKAEQYVREMMVKHKNKLSYDAATGEIRDDRKFMTMLEDYWIPRREGGKGTEIDTLPAGQSLGEIEDVEYFLKRLYDALGVPESRINPDQPFQLGKTDDITRDELKFSKFINRLRMRFSEIFTQALEKQLILKNIMLYDDWKAIKSKIRFNFISDSEFADLKENEILLTRLELLPLIQPFIGTYYSNEFVRKKVLKQTDEDIQRISMELASEALDPNYNPQIDAATGGDAGAIPPEQAAGEEDDNKPPPQFNK